ncbi:MAG: thiamine pyrophosphate-dependent enzyme [Kiritimatiellae bacterium]|jgi:2-oxoglutarate ferredoxin oxidoreductase subunit beta|nr:thiamine pyrophosphate-dependent enzyme [Kiritimatiellia bacterium]
MAKKQKIYGRPEALSSSVMHYCAGCGHSLVHKLLAEVMDELHIRDKTIGVAPVGCAVFAYYYLKCDISEAPHGRTPAVATGLKRVRPGRIIFSYQGDGDLAAIGMCETIHTANRGENITVIFINNTVYGMTGGQMAPTTLVKQQTPTCPAGRETATMGGPIRVCELLNTLDRPFYIERTALDGIHGILKTKKALLTAFKAQMDEKGYSFVEILSPCPTYFRLSPEDSLKFVKNELSRHFPVRVFRKEGVVIND